MQTYKVSLAEFRHRREYEDEEEEEEKEEEEEEEEEDGKLLLASTLFVPCSQWNIIDTDWQQSINVKFSGSTEN